MSVETVTTAGKTAAIESVFAVIDDPRALNVAFKLNRDASVKDLIRYAFKLPMNGEVSPWHIEIIKQINPTLLSEKDNLDTRVKAGSKIELGELGYEVRKERAEKLLFAYRGAFLKAKFENLSELSQSIKYLERILSTPPPEFLYKTSEIESKVARIFNSKTINKSVGEWLREIGDQRGDKLPPKVAQENIVSLIKELDSYIHSLSVDQRKKGVSQALNLVERIAPAFGIELTQWAIDRARDWSVKLPERTSRRFLSQLSESLVSEIQVANFEKSEAESAAKSCNSQLGSRQTKDTQIKNFTDSDRAQKEAVERVSRAWKLVDTYSIDNQLAKLEASWVKLGKNASPEFEAQFLAAKAELIQQGSSPQDSFKLRVQALKTLMDGIPGFEDGELRTKPLSPIINQRFAESFKKLPEEKQLQINRNLSELTSSLLVYAQSRQNIDKEKTLLQANVALRLLHQTSGVSSTAKLEHSGYQAKLSELEGRPNDSIQKYAQLRLDAQAIIFGGDKNAIPLLQTFARAEATLIARQDPTKEYAEKLTALSSSINDALPKYKAFQAEISLLAAQSLLQAGENYRARDLLAELKTKYAELPHVQKDLRVFLAEKSDEKLLAAIKTALGSWGKSSMLESAIYMGGGATIGGILGFIGGGGPGGAFAGAVKGFAIGQGILGLKNVFIDDWSKVKSSYQTGLTAIDANTALVSLAAATLDFVGTTKAVRMGVKLAQKVLTTEGAKTVFQSLMNGEGKQIASKLLRSGLGDTAYQAAAEKGATYLENKSAEYLQRLFRQAGRVTLDTPLDAAVGGGLMLNQGREIIAQLYVLQTDQTMTPAQKEKGYFQVAEQVAELVAFMGTVKAVTKGLDTISTRSIGRLRLRANDSVIRASETLQGVEGVKSDTRDTAPIVPAVSSLPRENQTITEKNLRTPGFGERFAFGGQRFQLAMPEPFDPERAANKSTELSPSEILGLMTSKKDRLMSLFDPVTDFEARRRTEREVNSAIQMSDLRAPPEVLFGSAFSIISVIVANAPSKLNQALEIFGLTDNQQLLMIGNLLDRSAEVKHIRIIHSLAPSVVQKVIISAKSRAFAETLHGKIFIDMLERKPPEVFIAHAVSAFEAQDWNAFNLANSGVPKSGHDALVDELFGKLSKIERGQGRALAAQALSDILSEKDVAALKSSFAETDQKMTLDRLQEAKLMAFAMARKGESGEVSPSSLRLLIGADLTVEEKVVCIAGLFGIEKDNVDPSIDPDTDFLILSDRLGGNSDFSVPIHIQKYLGAWLVELEDSKQVTNIEFIADILSNIPDDVTKLRIFDSITKLPDHPDARSLWANKYSKIPAASFLRVAELLDWNPDGLDKLNRCLSKFKGNTERVEFIQISESLFEFSPEYKTIFKQIVSELNLDEPDSQMELIRLLKNLNACKRTAGEDPVMLFRREMRRYSLEEIDEDPVVSVVAGDISAPKFKVDSSVREVFKDLSGKSLKEINRQIDQIIDVRLSKQFPNLSNPQEIAEFRAYWGDVSAPLTYLSQNPGNNHLSDQLGMSHRPDEWSNLRYSRRATNTGAASIFGRLGDAQRGLLQDVLSGGDSAPRPSAVKAGKLNSGIAAWRPNRAVQTEQFVISDGVPSSFINHERELARKLVGEKHHTLSATGSSSVFVIGFETIKPILEKPTRTADDFHTAKNLLASKISSLEEPTEAFGTIQQCDAALRVVLELEAGKTVPVKVKGLVEVFSKLGGDSDLALKISNNSASSAEIGKVREFFTTKKTQAQSVLSSALQQYSIPETPAGIKQLMQLRKELGAASSLVSLLELMNEPTVEYGRTIQIVQASAALKNFFGGTEFGRDLDNISKVALASTSPSAQPKNLLTLLTDDPRMMLNIGKYPKGSCQHYETGAMAHTLGSFVSDWFIKGAFVLDLSKLSLTSEQLAELKAGRIPADVPVDNILKSALVRRIVKFGASDLDNPRPAVFIEKPYSMLGPVEENNITELINKNIVTWFSESDFHISEAGDGDGKVYVPATLNPYGQYEDGDTSNGAENGHVKFGTYSVPGKVLRR